MSAPAERNQMVQQLTQQLRRYERPGRQAEGEHRVFSTGIAPLDELLPEQGLCGGTLVEWLSRSAAGGAGTLVFKVAAHAMRAGGACVVIDPGGLFYPPAAGMPADKLERMIVVHPAHDGDALWALEQSLRCRGVAVVVCRLGRVDNHAYRRLGLAAEAGGGIGLLLRSARYRPHPSWADVRMLVEPLPLREEGEREWMMEDGGWRTGRHLRVELVHCRGRTRGGTVELEIDDETGDVRLAAGLAAAKNTTQRAAGA